MTVYPTPLPSPVDNTPGGLVCPPWLLLLDDPAPERVLVIGQLDDPSARWFADIGARVEVRSVPGKGTDTAPVDLVVIASDMRARTRRGRDTAAFVRAATAACLPDAALVVPWGGRPSIRRLLARLGFTIVRPIRPILVTPGSRATPHGFVALRVTEPTEPRAGSSDADADRPPRWLADLSSGQPWAPGAGGWSMRVPGAYPSQKTVVLLRPRPDAAPTGLIKLTRHPRFNERLDNEFTVLRSVAARGGAAARRAPAALANDRVAGLSFVVEEAFDGPPFLKESKLDAGCVLAADAVRAIGDLGLGSTRSGAALADRLEGLREQFVARHRPSASVAEFLHQQVQVIAQSQVPDVLFHGDLGTWNLLVVDGAVRILDWESAEDPGPPLWDLAYFIRSYMVRAGRRRGLDRNRAIGRHLLGTSALNQTAAGWVRDYADRIGLKRELVEPLFHTCWMHRAVKEGARLAPDKDGHYGPLCNRLVFERDAAGIRNLVGR